MVGRDLAALEEQSETYAGESLAAADSLALPSDLESEIDSYESNSIAEESIAATDASVLSPEDEVHVNISFAEGSLAAADSLALPQDEEAYADHALYGKVQRKWKRRRNAVLTFSAFLLVAIIALAVVLTTTKDGRTGQSIDNIEGSDEENKRDDNIFLPEIYSLLEPKVHNPAALLDINTPEGKAFSVLVEESEANQSTALRSSAGSYIQRYALLVLYFGTNGGAWINSAGWTTRSEDYEEWHGVVYSDPYVIGIDLGENNLSGKISEDFCLVDSLKVLRLSGNMVEIPSCLPKLSELNELDLRGNDYVGELPSNLYAMPSLTSLQLSDNEFEGSIDRLFPKAKSNDPIFPNLRTLNLANNNLSGKIPENTLRKLPNLEALILNGNKQLSGSLNEMCKGDELSRIDADCDVVSCKCCTSGESCPSSPAPV